MHPGYWIHRLSLLNKDLFFEYQKTVVPWLNSVGGVICSQNVIHTKSNTKPNYILELVVKFNSISQAHFIFSSKEFQDYIHFRNIQSNLFCSILSSSKPTFKFVDHELY